MQGGQCGANEVWALTGVEHQQAKLVHSTKLLIEAALQLLGLGLTVGSGGGGGSGRAGSV